MICFRIVKTANSNRYRAGCKFCHTLYEKAKEAAQKLDLLCDVEYITDIEKIMAYGVMRMPAKAEKLLKG